MQGICILGATGSIGKSTIDVVLRHPEQYKVVAITAHSNVQQVMELAVQVKPDYIVISDERLGSQAASLLKQYNLQSQLLLGAQALVDVVSLDDVDVVMAAIVGAAGLLPTLAAVEAGKTLCLANKEALVMSGELFIQAAQKSGAKILPVDSEHNAIFQALPDDYQYGELATHGISKILLTGSGGPFLNTPLAELSGVTPAQACAHPNWDMGQKISVDSATMMNKGLEFIEACWLFGVQSSDVQVVLHPQSIIHSMVQYVDGSVIAQLGNPDMRTPIAHCLAYPKRIVSGVQPPDFSTLTDFTFCSVDFQRFPNLRLAIDACEAGQYATTAINAANEIAVEMFLRGQIKFTDIATINQHVLQHIEVQSVKCLEDVIHIDAKSRELAQQHIGRIV